MYIQVKLLKGFTQPLLYKVPEHWNTADLIGSFVRVPIKKKVVPAVVTNWYATAPQTRFAIREALTREAFPADMHYHTYLEQLGTYYQCEPMYFFKRIAHFLSKPAVTPELEMVESQDTVQRTTTTLTNEQQAVCDFVIPHIITPAYTPTMLHGVTGSGKTEVYKKLLQTTIAQGKTALFMLPEVTLALQFEKILRAQLPQEIKLHRFHSATSPKEKRMLWSALIAHEPMVIIGVHLPILLPIANLGLIIIDEEHEIGYQEKKHPKINSKEAAIMRAHAHGIPIVLGSATPSVSSLYNVKTKGWHFFQLKHRFSGTFPTIKTVFLTDKKQRRNFWVSQELQDAITDRLQAREQVIIFLNRRGFSFFVQCKNCSFTFTCTTCSVSLTLHQDNQLTCHYCTQSMMLPNTCPSCKKPDSEFIKKGIGTQQAVSILEKLFPHARIGRADLDVTAKKKLWQQTLHDFEHGSLDILVGTQTITKGFHFPKVTLVGILWADLNLHFPIFNATETTLQQLIQVAGRAGRQSERSLVIVQAMADHPVFEHLDERTYVQFYTNELENRITVGYPPHMRLVELELKNDHEATIEQEALKLTTFLRYTAVQKKLDLRILGPAKPPVYKIKDTHMRKIYIKGMRMQDMYALFQSITMNGYKSKIYFTPNPLS